LSSKIKELDPIEFAAAPAPVEALLQQGVWLYRQDRAAAEVRFRQALKLDPTVLSTYFCLYKIHAYQGRSDEAMAIAADGLKEAARQAGLSPDWRQWSRQAFAAAAPDPARFAVYTLKALAFVDLRRGENARAQARLEKLRELAEVADVGCAVVAGLAEAVA
jgi:hypothetical protein